MIYDLMPLLIFEINKGIDLMPLLIYDLMPLSLYDLMPLLLFVVGPATTFFFGRMKEKVRLKLAQFHFWSMW